LFSTIGAILYFIIQPKFVPKELQYNIIAVVFISTYIIPILFLFILKRRNSIDSFHLKTINERKFPVLFYIILNLLLGVRLLEFVMVELLSLSFIATSLALIFVFILFFYKIKTSLHTLAIGGFIGFLIGMSYHYQIRILILIAFIFLLFGVVANARLKLKAHNQKEIYIGLFLGIVTQLMVYYIYYKM
jgi:hypothetical protein